MSMDVARVRTQFPALTVPDAAGNLPLYLDGPGGGQAPQPVLDAIVGYLGHYNSNLGGRNLAARHTTDVVARARTAAADWLGGTPEGIVFGANSTSNLFNISRAVARTWRPGDNIVVTDLDHFANVSSWRAAAEDAGVQVRVLPLDADSVDLDYGRLDLIDDRTRLVAVTAASNLMGTIPDVARVVAAAHAVGALVSLDAVHAAVHRLIDARRYGADLLFASAYKLGGPHVGVCVARPDLLVDLRPYKVEPATELAPGRWEQGTQAFESLAGLTAMVDYVAGLGDGPGRRERLASAYDRIAAHERELTAAVLAGFAARPTLRLHGRDGVEARTPTFAFELAEGTPDVLAPALVDWLGERNVAVGLGNFYALGVVRSLGAEAAGVLRIGAVHYTTVAEIERFFSLLDEGLATLA